MQNGVMRYQFTITVSGDGSTPEEAWQDAIECFSIDPGSTPEQFTTEEIITA